VLAERSREARDKKFIQDAIEKVFSVKLNLQQYYEDFFNTHLLQVFSDVPKELNLPPIILSR
jgi:midasin (ATPase involved in ribosome maturation)